MKKIYLCLLAFVLFTGQVFAQSGDYTTQTINGRTVHFIKEGTSAYTLDKNKAQFAMPSTGYGYMKFVIENNEAWVYSRTGHTDNGEIYYPSNDNSHWAITNQGYTGNITIPAYLKLNGTEIPVVGVEHYAFHQLPLKGTITLDCPDLKFIGKDAFSVLAKDNSYTKVTIKSDAAELVIKERAFKNIIFTTGQYNSSLTRQACLANGWILYNRTCLEEVDIQTKNNLDIEKEAFIYCEALQRASIVSDEGNVSIGEQAFACGQSTPEAPGTAPAVYVSHPLDRMWKRTTDLDSIYISAKSGLNIGMGAFAHHINIKRVHINVSDPTAQAPVIGVQAFMNLFHGYGDNFQPADKAKLGIFIKAPFRDASISGNAFRNFFYTNGGGDPSPYVGIGYGTFKPANVTLSPASIEYENCLNTVEIENTSHGIDPSTDWGLTISGGAFSDHFIASPHNTYPGTFRLTGNISAVEENGARIYPYTSETMGKKSRLRTIDINDTFDFAEIGLRAFSGHMTSDSPADPGSITLTNVNVIHQEAFYKNEKAMDVKIFPNSTIDVPLTIGANAFEYNFQHSNNNGTLTINGDVEMISPNAFANGPGLETVTVNNTSTTTGLTIDQKAFYRSMGTVLNGNVMDETTELFKTGSVTLTGNLKAIGANAFNEMAGMKTFDLTSDTRFSIGPSAFENNFNFDDLKYTAGGTTKPNTLPDRVSWVGNKAFANTGFTQMTIPQLTLKYSDKASLGTGFKQASVNGVSVPASLDDHDVYNRNDLLSSQVFTKCKKLTSVTIDNSATGQATFADCPLLETVNFGTNVKYIESGVFHKTPKLSFLTIPENVEVIGAAIKSNANDNLSYRIEFLAKQPPLAHINAFATKGESEQDIANSGEGGRQAFVVVPWGSVSSYLFCSENRGFQNVTGDNISCAYKLNKTWGSLGMQAHTIREYTGTFDGEGYMAPKLTVLDTTTKPTRSFTDVYDYRRVGITPEGSVATNGKSPASGDDAERQAVLDAINANADNLIAITRGVFGLPISPGTSSTAWRRQRGYSKLHLIFKAYKWPDQTNQNGIPQIEGYTSVQNKELYKEKCEALWNDLRHTLGSPYQNMSLEDFVNNILDPGQFGTSTNATGGSNVNDSETDNYPKIFNGAPTVELLRLLLTDEYYDYFILKFIKNHPILAVTNSGYVPTNIFTDLEWNTYCKLTQCTSEDNAPLVKMYNDYVTFVRDLNQQINQYYADYPIHIDWETDREFYVRVHEPFKTYTADTYYKHFGKVGIDLLLAGPIVPNSLTGQPWNNGYLVNGTAGQTYYLFHYIGEGSDGKAISLGTKLGSGNYTDAKYEALKGAAHTNFKAGKTNNPVIWWNNTAANATEGVYKYDVYPNLLIAACNASDITSSHYLYGMDPGVTAGDQSVNFPMDYTLYNQDGGTGITKCRLYLLSNGAFARFRNWTQLSEGKSFLALPTQTMAGYKEGNPYVGATAAGSNDAKPEFFIHNNDFRFLVDLPEIIPTEIETIGYEDEEDGEDIRIVKGYWYTLDGSRLATPPTKKGIYIHNGKKIVVR